ncbi:PilZ domain-containing protein [Geminocystis sp. CENA526]|uniref:PilZ domain-containing protein n=1 Tax=Geminocystis sp. CENA526 TaxID=1355871 RepID=UPI003D6FE69A
MTQINEQRNYRRVLAVCRVLDSQGKFLGFTLDLTPTGIQIIVNKDFPQDSEFEIILSQARENEILGNDLKIKVQQMWRSNTNEEFDQIGGKIIEVDSPSELENLVAYCDRKAKERYQFDLELKQS